MQPAASQDPLARPGSDISPDGGIRSELGLLLKSAVVKSLVRIGRVARLLQNTPVGAAAVGGIDRYPLPMPVSPTETPEKSLMVALTGGATVAQLRMDFPRPVPLAGRAARSVMLALLVNVLYLGWKDAGHLEHARPGELTVAEAQAQQCRVNRQAVPGPQWGQLLAVEEVRYDAELEVKGQPTALAADGAGPAIAGRRCLDRRRGAGQRGAGACLRAPAHVVKSRSRWPEMLGRTCVLCCDGEWSEIGEGL